MRHSRSYILTGIAVVLVAGAAVDAQQWTPPTPTNLKVFDKNIAPRELVGAMRGFTQALGVRCPNCHVYKGENPDDLSAFDFASDEKAAKLTTRTMMRMVGAINNDLLKGVGDPPPAGESKVTCFTCHRGDKKPLTRRPPQP